MNKTYFHTILVLFWLKMFAGEKRKLENKKFEKEGNFCNAFFSVYLMDRESRWHVCSSVRFVSLCSLKSVYWKMSLQCAVQRIKCCAPAGQRCRKCAWSDFSARLPDVTTHQVRFFLSKLFKINFCFSSKTNVF